MALPASQLAEGAGNCRWGDHTPQAAHGHGSKPGQHQRASPVIINAAMLPQSPCQLPPVKARGGLCPAGKKIARR
jgi:hypothetical protein